MGWVKNLSMSVPENARVRVPLIDREGEIGSHRQTPLYHLAILLDGMDDFVFIPYSAVEVFVPDPPAKQYEQTDYYMEKETGALYKRQFSNSDGGLSGNPVWHLICLNQIKPSIRCPREDNVPANFKRLYKEA